VENSSSTCSSSSTSSSSSGTSPSSVKKAGPDRVPRFVWRTLKKKKNKQKIPKWLLMLLFFVVADILSLISLLLHIFYGEGG
jgi:hypothetical protein